jgi:hypothetical protein
VTRWRPAARPPVRPDLPASRALPSIATSSQQPQQPLPNQLAVLAVAGAVTLALLPGVLAGLTLAAALRRRALRWTWALLLAPPMAPTLLVALHTPPHLPRHLTAREILAAGVLPWLWTIVPTTVVAKLWRDRRDRLHGGAAERRLARSTGPLDHVRRRRQHRRDVAQGPYAEQSGGVLLGHDRRGASVRLPTLKAHATIVGGSNSGKTNTATVLLEGHVAQGAGFVILDGKGGRDLPAAAIALGKTYNKPVTLWSITPYGDATLDARRQPWNPVGEGSPTEVKDRIAGSEEQTEPYYKAVASRGLLIAATLNAQQGAMRLDTLAAGLDAPGALADRLPADHIDHRWLKSLNDGERSALRGIATRLRTMVGGDGGAALTPDHGDPQINLTDAIRDGHLVVFTLPEGLYPELIPNVAKYVLQALAGVCSRIETTGRPADALVFVDELSAFDGDQLASGFERGRSAGVRFLVATQSLSNLATAGGDKLLHAAIDNAELLVIHRQAVPDTVELLASIGGTEEAWEHTHKVSDSLVTALGHDETGDRARRLTDRFRAHPNEIKQLGLGEAIVISHRPAFAVRPISVRPYRSPRTLIEGRR